MTETRKRKTGDEKAREIYDRICKELGFDPDGPDNPRLRDPAAIEALTNLTATAGKSLKAEFDRYVKDAGKIIFEDLGEGNKEAIGVLRSFVAGTFHWAIDDVLAAFYRVGMSKNIEDDFLWVVQRMILCSKGSAIVQEVVKDE